MNILQTYTSNWTKLLSFRPKAGHGQMKEIVAKHESEKLLAPMLRLFCSFKEDTPVVPISRCALPCLHLSCGGSVEPSSRKLLNGSLPRPSQIISSITTQYVPLYCTVLYCTVLYCTDHQLHHHSICPAQLNHASSGCNSGIKLASPRLDWSSKRTFLNISQSWKRPLLGSFALLVESPCQGFHI